MWRCHKGVHSALFLTVLLLLSAICHAEPVGLFSRVDGRVDILRVGAAAALPVGIGNTVSMGDIVRTKSDGKAEIRFKDDTSIRLAPGSRVRIDEYTFNPDNSRKGGALSLFRGKVRALVTKTTGKIVPIAAGTSTFNIQTPTTIAGVRGSDVFTFHERGVTGVLFREGYGFVYNITMPGRIVNIRAGQATFVLRPDALPLAPRRATDVELMRHIKDTTLAEKAEEPKEGEKPEARPVDIASGAAAIETLSAEESFAHPIPAEVVPVPGVAVGVSGGTETSTLVPITETHSEMLTTPVTVNVRFP